MPHKTIDMFATAAILKGKFQSKGMNSQQIAEEFDVSVVTVHYWLTGKKLPSLNHLAAISGILDCGIDDLIVIR